MALSTIHRMRGGASIPFAYITPRTSSSSVSATALGMLGVFIFARPLSRFDKKWIERIHPIYICSCLRGVILRSNLLCRLPQHLSFHEYAPWRSSLRRFQPLLPSVLLSASPSHTAASKAHAPLVCTLTATPSHGDRRDRLASGTFD